MVSGLKLVLLSVCSYDFEGGKHLFNISIGERKRKEKLAKFKNIGPPG